MPIEDKIIFYDREREIYLLLRMKPDFFGEEPNVWLPVSWTDDLDVAIKWKAATHLHERFDFKSIPKYPTIVRC